MKLTIDKPCSVTLRTGREGQISLVLDILGGSLWFRDVPVGVKEGDYKSCEIEVLLRSIRTENGTRSVFVPHRIITLQK